MKSVSVRRTDFLAACQASQASNPVLEEIRSRGAEVVLSLFRLAKNALVHALDNDAMVKTVEQTCRILTDFSATVGGLVSITFIDQTIFVCGQLMRASRSVYESGMELGRLLERCGASEISVTSEVTERDLSTFAEAFSLSARDPKQRDKLLQTKFNHLSVRKVDSTLIHSRDETDLPELEQTLLAYASALVVVRDYFDRVSQFKPVMLYRLKRIAQRLVTLAEQHTGSTLALTTLAHAHRDDAGRAVQSAILSILIARQLTANRAVLGQLALSALIADAGRVQKAGPVGRDRLVRLSEEAEKTIPALTTAICIASGGVTLQSAHRAVTVYETSHTEREALLGPIYKRALSALVQSKILRVARALLDYVAPRDTARPLSMLDALAAVSQLPNIDKVAYRLLVAAIGLMPTGTVVEFETGEWGIVVGPSNNKAAVGKPRIKLITDRAGRVFDQPKEIDLGETEKRRYPPITGVIEPDKARFNVTSLFG